MRIVVDWNRLLSLAPVSDASREKDTNSGERVGVRGNCWPLTLALSPHPDFLAVFRRSRGEGEGKDLTDIGKCTILESNPGAAVVV